MLAFGTGLEDSTVTRAIWSFGRALVFDRFTSLGEALPQAPACQAMRSKLRALASAASAALAASTRLWSDLMVSVFALAVWSATSRISAWLTTIWAGYVGPMALMWSTCCTSYFAGIRSGFLKRLG